MSYCYLTFPLAGQLKCVLCRVQMSELSSTVGIPGNCMYPVWNYSSGSVDNNEDMDTLILTALKYMLHHADDFLKK